MNLIPGDIIYVNRGLYQHYGIYVGSGRVVHFSGGKKQEISVSEADIIKERIQNFTKGGKPFILREKKDSEYNALPTSEIVRRAESKIGKCKGEYSLLFNNCEHFAYWCRYGKKESRQIKQVVSVMTGLGSEIAFDSIPVSIGNLFFLIIRSFFKEKKINTLEDFLLEKTETVERLGFEKIVSFFKNPKQLDILKSDSNLLATVIKEVTEDDSTLFICTIFDSKSKEIKNFDNVCCFKTKFAEKDLLELFSDKDMLVLQ